ncbi:MAG: SDR family NAD(P)-dependent oxidoreductase, partial [Ktedonobacteraceae bacterium]|nr:SDR family NAD(P)-dependent oxidoreductase [Ktedonobacteraceae bacterium]
MQPEIALVGMACRYPDARSPLELWENVLAQRQAFRRFPSERLCLQDYFNADRLAPDTTYSTQGAFLEDYAFDRVRFHISGSTYRASDLAHWLALDIASQALQDAGFHSKSDLPADTTAVIVGNTLTGEFSRANGLRLRWPYVRRVVEATLLAEGWLAEQCHLFLDKLEKAYKEPFAPVGEETLAGGLSNTIAGRICNYFNLKGGGYTVDGACASSLLAVITACKALADGDIDLAIAGGIDLSLDPFELVGFAKTAALASQEMRVYDARSDGFLPGEGCGFVALMRYEDALAHQRRIYALIRGWGISSDGSGGITRPEVEGQSLALARAYKRAGMSIASIAYFEGHGTGTRVGDSTELQALSRARRQANAATTPAVIGSIKANIGHTKAAAGIAGLIKATMALHTQILPPTTGTVDPHAEFQSEQPALRVLDTGLLWPADAPLRAAVNAMGFGGINTHVILEGCTSHRRTTLTSREQVLFSSIQHVELMLLREQSVEDTVKLIDQLLLFSARLSKAELTDLAVYLAEHMHEGDMRVAIVAKNAQQFTTRLEQVKALLLTGTTSHIDTQDGIFLGTGTRVARVGFLFTGQGAPVYRDGGLLQRRFACIEQLYAEASLAQGGDEQDTAIAQPAIVTASLAALCILRELGITATVAIGHSLGELTALHWAGALDEKTLLRLASVRGQIMSALGDPTGKMASIMASKEQVEALIGHDHVVISGINAPRHTVISGEAAAIASVVARAKALKVPVMSLSVTQAFHSPLVTQAIQPFAEWLACEQFLPLQRAVYSTVTGALLDTHVDLKELLCRQITAPVQFLPVLNAAASDVDLWLEVGPGNVLQGIASKCIAEPVIALNVGGRSLEGVLASVGAAFALGVPLHHAYLYTNRFSRPFDLNWQPHFLINPCELAPLPEREHRLSNYQPEEVSAQPICCVVEEGKSEKQNGHLVTSAIELVKQIVAGRAELPQVAIGEQSRMLSDLHLNSITVGQIVSEAARALQLLPPVEPTQYADATIAEIAQALEELQQSGGTAQLEEQMKFPAGVDAWVRPFTVASIEEPLPLVLAATGPGTWQLLTPYERPLTAQLRTALAEVVGDGVVVCLPPEVTEQHISLLLEGARMLLEQQERTHFVLVQYGGEASGLARTLFLEAQQKTVCVVDLPLPEHAQAVNWVVAEMRAAQGYSEVRYDSGGKRYISELQLLLVRETRAMPLGLGADDVLLVTGGGKGIAAECAISLACKFGSKLALLGRSKSESDQELNQNLQRMQVAGIPYHYYNVDVSQPEAVRQAIRDIECGLGTVTAVLHGAGVNVPKLLGVLEQADVMHTFAPKVHGLQNVLAALDTEKLRLLVTFGSVIARTGMRGEADYALANDWLARLTETFHRDHPACRCLCLEWSIWSGVGMGQRLGRVEALLREGIVPIAPDDGINLLCRLLDYEVPAVRIVVTSRVTHTPTLTMGQSPLPFLRFLEQPRIFYPGIELVVDVDLSLSTDLYIEDHTFRGERLLPAVVGLEAIAQAAMAVSMHNVMPDFEQIELKRPIVVPQKGVVKVRIAALVRESGKVDVVLRSEETAFQVDHFRATCSFAAHAHKALERLEGLRGLPEELPVPIDLDPQHDLYGSILFHQGRFRRIRNYRHLRATACIAELTSCSDAHLYAHYLPAEMVLGDFTARDAVIHAIQACIPHTTLLPISIEQIALAANVATAIYTRFVYAKERSRQADIFTYDVEVRTEHGEVVEQWRGLHLQQVEVIKAQKPWKLA